MPSVGVKRASRKRQTSQNVLFREMRWCSSHTFPTRASYIESALMSERTVLSVEDDDAAFQLLKIAFTESQAAVHLIRVSDGEEAIAFLERRGTFHDAPRPDLVLLNMNLPKKSGLEVLAEVAASESLRSIPIVVFTASSLQSERARCMALGARDFVTKPANFDGLIDAVKSACARASA